MRHVAWLLPLLLAVLPACSSSASGLPAGTRAAPPGEVTPAFQGMRTLLIDAQQLERQGDVAGLKAMSPQIEEMGLGLLKTTLPHDVRRADVPRYMEGRAAFGRALKVWVLRVAEADGAELGERLGDLVDAYWGWVDAYKGLPPERSV